MLLDCVTKVDIMDGDQSASVRDLSGTGRRGRQVVSNERHDLDYPVYVAKTHNDRRWSKGFVPEMMVHSRGER